MRRIREAVLRWYDRSRIPLVLAIAVAVLSTWGALWLRSLLIESFP